MWLVAKAVHIDCIVVRGGVWLVAKAVHIDYIVVRGGVWLVAKSVHIDYIVARGGLWLVAKSVHIDYIVVRGGVRLPNEWDIRRSIEVESTFDRLTHLWKLLSLKSAVTVGTPQWLVLFSGVH